MRAEARAHEIEGRGRTISTAILYEVAAAFAAMEPGREALVRTDALPALESDLRAWCRTTGHELLAVEEDGRELLFRIRKTDRPRTQPPWALVISDPGLEELLSPLGFALAAALGGSRVALYFQGPATRVLTRGFRERLKGIFRAPFSGFARRGLAGAGHPSPHEKLRQLRELGARIYICAGSMEHFKVSRDQLLFPDIRLATYTPLRGPVEFGRVTSVVLAPLLSARRRLSRRSPLRAGPVR